MQQLTKTGIVTSLELVEQINIFRREERAKGSTDRLHADIVHKSLLEIIRDEFREEIGRNELVPSYYINSQNKEQPMFELTLSQAKQVLTRESRIVRKAVIAHIERLEEQLLNQKPKTQIELIIESALVLQQHEQRLNDVENKLAQLEESRNLAIQELLLAERSQEKLPEETTRVKIRRLVNQYCSAKNADQQSVWRVVYDRLYYRYGVSLRAVVKKNNENMLDVAERLGHLDKIFTICSNELV